MKRYFVNITHEDAQIVCGWFDPIEAIAQMQSAIAELRRRHAPTFDASYGEQPMPVLGQSEQEFA